MYRPDTLRFVVLSSLAFIIHSAPATADCVKPAWTDFISLERAAPASKSSSVFKFHARVHEFIACQRGTLQKRANGLAPPEVRQLVLRDRETEELALVEVEQIGSCLSLATGEPDQEAARMRCDKHIKYGLQQRRPPKAPAFKELKREQRNEYGGVWSFRTLDLERPGHCNDAPCDNMFAVEVTNTTAVALRCEVALTVFNAQDGTRRGDQVITLYPGDSLPAARVWIRRSPESIEPAVVCSRAMPLVPAIPVPAACVLNWYPHELEYPRSLSREWESGAAVVEVGTQLGHKPAEAINVVQEDSPRIGGAARALIEKQNFSTNCAGQHFRVRVEYRAFPCHVCEFEYGVVTLLRDHGR